MRREREGARRLWLPITSVPCGRCLSSPPDAGVDVWLHGASPHAVLALSFLSKESFHYFILFETFTLKARVCHLNSCQASMRVPIKVFRRGFPHLSVFSLSPAEQRKSYSHPSEL